MDIPDDTPPPRLAGLSFDGGGEPVTTDVLRQVLTRHRRRQSRVLGAVAAGVLVGGAVIGFVIGDGRGTSGTQLTAGNAPAASHDATPPPVAALAYGNSNGTSGIPATQLLLRNATDGTRVRLYSDDLSNKMKCAAGQTCPQPDPACFPTTILSGEVSDDQVAGTTGGPVWHTPTATGLDAVNAGVVGVGQPQPILTVMGHAGSDIAQVRLATPYGSDVQAVTSGGWVGLAMQLPADFKADPASGGRRDLPAGTLTALSPSGAVVGSVALVDINGKPSAPPCQPPCPSDLQKATTAGGSAKATICCPPPPAPPAPTAGSKSATLGTVQCQGGAVTGSSSGGPPGSVSSGSAAGSAGSTSSGSAAGSAGSTSSGSAASGSTSSSAP